VTTFAAKTVGAAIDRLDGPDKVTGAARYAFEQPVAHAAYLYIVQSTIARGHVRAIDATGARALPGVVEVITHENAPRLASTEDPELVVLQSNAVAYHGQIVAAVVAETPEVARHAAALIRVQYHEEPHDVELHAGREGLYQPDPENVGFEPDTHHGDVEAALKTAAASIDVTYTTPHEHNNPMEPHATIALWEGDSLTLYDANQGPHAIRGDVATAFGLEPERVRVISPHVGGGFGSKLFTHGHVVLAAMAAKLVARPVKLALTRQQMFALVGYRTPTIQRMRLGTDNDGRLVAIAHDVTVQTSKIEESVETAAVVTRMMYAAPNRRTSHRLARLDVPTPTIMRAPGECPGVYALECAMDEMALACERDPIEFRIRNEPERDPGSGKPFSSRGLVACLREGAQRFGWQPHTAPAKRRDGNWLVGTGVASSTYPTRRRPTTASVRVNTDGTYRVQIDAIDIGTGARTALAQIAADALETPLERVRLDIADSALPRAGGAGGSMGLASWGTAIVEAANALREKLRTEFAGNVPAEGVEAYVEVGRNPLAERYSMHAFGAQFAEVRIDADTHEIRVPRLFGMFAAGRIVNAKTARSQLIGGMVMGLSMALFEETVIDKRFGHFANHDFAEYHIASNADVLDIDAAWIDEDDPYVNSMGAKGIGELGITGTASAIANALYDATGLRLRDLPLRLPFDI